MRLVLASLIVAIAALSPQAGAQESPKKGTKDAVVQKVACVGDSITQGSGYPNVLQKMLDTTNARFLVQNFGVSGSTMMMKSNLPYAKQRAFADALKFEPNVIVLMLGTNDTRKANPNTYEHIADFVGDGTKIVKSFQALASKPKIFLCIPVPIYGTGNYGLNNENLVAGVIPGIRKIADATKVTLLDMNTPLADHAAWFGDRIHPNGDGAKMIAGTAFRAITGTEPPAVLMPAAAKK
jgi:lysophospholipase L1-like esterase